MSRSRKVHPFVLPALALLLSTVTAQDDRPSDLPRGSENFTRIGSLTASLEWQFADADEGFEGSTPYLVHVDSSGDFNADGRSDILLTLTRYELKRPASGFHVGGAIVVSGADGTLLQAHGQADRDDYVKLRGVVSGKIVDDLNRDGVADILLLTVARSGTFSPSVEVVSGRTGDALASLGPSKLEGQLRSFGTSYDSAGDVNGDGWVDVFVGAPGCRLRIESVTADGNLPPLADGVLCVYSGKDWSVIWQRSSPWLENGFATSAAAAGDVDGDGHADLAAGVPLAPMLRFRDYRKGAVFLFSGPDGSLIRQIEGEPGRQGMGSVVENLGDIDGDQRSELLIGANSEWASERPDILLIVKAADGSILDEITQDRLEPGRPCNVVRTGDLNGDGVDEVILVVQPAATAAEDNPSPSIWVWDVVAGRSIGRIAAQAEGPWLPGVGGRTDVNDDGIIDIILCESVRAEGKMVRVELGLFELAGR